jgi:hypothetical protein
VVCGGLLKMSNPCTIFQQEDGGPIYMPIVLELSFNTMGPVFKGQLGMKLDYCSVQSPQMTDIST